MSTAISLPALTATMKASLGLPSFRPFQLSPITALLNHHDVAVYWSTGSGKSLVFTLPPLHTGKTAVVISPLISLMRDQVTKLNAVTNDPNTATFLGTAQLDSSTEPRVARGDFKIVYITPEKLASFMPSLAAMQAADNLSLIAIDEAHCLSQWGHDFRPAYLKIGDIRNHPTLSKVPIAALTGTATNKVRADIARVLKLRNPVISTTSVDRENLKLVIRTKPAGGHAAALEPYIKRMLENKESTIIYCYSRADVDKLASYVTSSFGSKNAKGSKCLPYHAGMSNEDRDASHMQFLTSEAVCIVATSAFGMGIDKPDTRRIIHWTAPKTMEEYYQQIGRAGRDGIPSECVMFHGGAADFSRYAGDFYTQAYTDETAKKEVASSTAALQSFTLNASNCRRAAIMQFFNETPSFASGRCGTCDNCCTAAAHGGDLTRDFTADATVLLTAVGALREPALGIIEKVIAGIAVEDWRWGNASQKGLIAEFRSRLPKRRTAAFWKELVPLLATADLIKAVTKTSQGDGGGRSNSWTGYTLTAKGMLALSDPATPIMLPVPTMVRDEEAKQAAAAAAKQAKTKKALQDLGLDESLQGEEAEEMLTAARPWKDKVASASPEEQVILKELEDAVAKWRQETAVKMMMAPVNVCAELTMYLILVASAKSARGAPDEQALRSLGCLVGSSDLVAALQPVSQKVRANDQLAAKKVWDTKVQHASNAVALQALMASVHSRCGGGGTADPVKIAYAASRFRLDTAALVDMGCDAATASRLATALSAWADDNGIAHASSCDPLDIPASFRPKKWSEAVYKPLKNGSAPKWEQRYNTWVTGATVSKMMAMEDKPVLPATIISNVLEAMVQGFVVDPRRLAMEATALGCMLSESDYDAIEGTGVEFSAPYMPKKDWLPKIEGMEWFADVEYADFDEEQKKSSGVWTSRFTWWLSLRRAGFAKGGLPVPPTTGGATHTFAPTATTSSSTTSITTAVTKPAQAPKPDEFDEFGDDFGDVDFDAMEAEALKQATTSKRPANPYAAVQKENVKQQKL